MEKNEKSQKLVKWLSGDELGKLLSKKPSELETIDILLILSIFEKEYPRTFYFVKSFLLSKLRYTLKFGEIN